MGVVRAPKSRQAGMRDEQRECDRGGGQREEGGWTERVHDDAAE